ncbi:MAG: large subunit ribosomal protein L21 [Paracoccaceae bacterium]|jgi:large subunit ribosomal protein L21
MFAVLKTGGKQYKVQAGDVLRVEKLAAEAGDKIQFNDILMVGGESVTVGVPFVAGAAVQAEVIAQIKGEKLIHYVKRRRKHSSQRTKGHRQHLTLLRVTEILAKNGEKTGVMAALGTADARRVAHNTLVAPAAAAPKAKAEAVPKAAPKAKAEAVPKAKAEAVPKAKAEAVPKAAPKVKAEAVPKAAPKVKAEAAPAGKVSAQPKRAAKAPAASKE